tara:strand:+ start:218 stop:793 length:576 start_codon:yes stop_codon:yes gene_type:complete
MVAIFDTFVAYKFIKILTTPWKKTDAFKLGLIDNKGNPLVKRSDLKTDKEKKAYTIVHVLIWNIKRLMDKLPITKTRLGSFATALWLLKDKKVVKKPEVVEGAFLNFIGIETPKKNVMESYLDGDNHIDAGVYMSRNILPELYDFIDNKDTILVEKEDPEGQMLGVYIFSGIHKKTGNKVVFSNEDILRIG